MGSMGSAEYLTINQLLPWKVCLFSFEIQGFQILSIWTQFGREGAAWSTSETSHYGWTESVVSISFFWWIVRDSCAASDRAVICQVSEGSAVEWAVGISVAGSGIKGSLPLSRAYQYTSTIFTKRQHCKGAANWQINSIRKTLWGIRHWLSCTDFGNQSLCVFSIYPNKLWTLKVSFYQFSKSWCISNFK